MAREEDGFFDDLARGLADGSITRGKALRLMGAALLGGTLGSLGIDGEAGADPPGCKRNGKHCTRNEQCCSGNCEGGTCAAACGSGQVLCNGNCVSNSCPTGQVFNTSTCQCECPPGQEVCGGRCGTSIGATCTGNTDCCSGRCASGLCAEPCPSDKVLVSNGTCAIPCTSNEECPGFPSCACLNSTEGRFCAGSQSGNFCDTGFCGTGELCSFGVCFTACL